MGAIVADQASGKPRRRRVHGRLRAGADRRGADRVRRLDRRVRARAPGDHARWRRRWSSLREHARTGAPAGGGTPAGDRRRGAARLRRPAATAARRRREIARAAGNLRADPLSPLRLEAGALPRLPRGGVDVACGTRSTRSSRSWASARRSPRSARRSREFHASGGIKPVDALDPGVDRGRARTRRSARFLRRQLREVHDYVAGAVRRAQAAGGVPADRDPDAEAWIFVGAALLISFADRLGGLLGPDEFSRMAAERRRWLTGTASRPNDRGRREAKPTLQGLGADRDLHSQIPNLIAPRSKRETSPAAAPGTFLEASCHSGDTPRIVTLRLDHGSCGCGGRLFGGAPLHSGLASAGASWPHCTSTVRKSQVARSSDLL